ncbi:YciI family protein [Immundisolibacter sp.]|uniref:YciI family protein n=1 Tax=Immundisolibacter sp. TaxID=1934948 RepID=UPI003568BBDC
MLYVVISRFDDAAVARLRSELPADAFAYIDEAIHHQRVPGQADIEAQGVAPGLASVLAAHLAHLTELRGSGKLVSGGPCTGFVNAINIFEAESDAQARALHDADPLAKHGFFAVETIYPWQRVF